MHICKICCYKTNRKSNYDYHINRKNPCKSTEEKPSQVIRGQNVDAEGQNVDAGGQNVDAGGQNVDAGGQNVDAGGQNVDAEVHTCDKCSKYLSCDKSLKRHHINCKGLDKTI